MLRVVDLSALAVITVLAGCVSQQEYRRAMADNANLRSQRDAVAGYVKDLRDENGQLSAQVQRLGKNAADADWIREQKTRLQEMIDGLQGGSALPAGVTVRQGAEGIVVDVKGEVLFASGAAKITTAGKTTLRQILPSINRPGQALRIEGHTDTDPIVNSSWVTNLRLSTERALAVAEFLIAEGFPPELVGTAGYGEYRPVAPGTDEVAKRANRRVEILLLDKR